MIAVRWRHCSSWNSKAAENHVANARDHAALIKSDNPNDLAQYFILVQAHAQDLAGKATVQLHPESNSIGEPFSRILMEAAIVALLHTQVNKL